MPFTIIHHLDLLVINHSRTFAVVNLLLPALVDQIFWVSHQFSCVYLAAGSYFLQVSV